MQSNKSELLTDGTSVKAKAIATIGLSDSDFHISNLALFLLSPVSIPGYQCILHEANCRIYHTLSILVLFHQLTFFC